MTLHPSFLSRSRFLAQTGGMLAASSWARAELRPEGGNAVDALIATALEGTITQSHQTGIGGYAAHGMFAMDGGRRIAALDANTMAPTAFTKDIIKPAAQGRVPDVIAGLKLALEEFGTISFVDVLPPSQFQKRQGRERSKPGAGPLKAVAALGQGDFPPSIKLQPSRYCSGLTQFIPCQAMHQIPG